MAKLEELAALMNVKIPLKNDLTSPKVMGKKRRPWLDDNQEISFSPPLSPLLDSNFHKEVNPSILNEPENRVQTGYKPGTEPDTSRVQTEYTTGYIHKHEPSTNQVQTEYKLSTGRVQTGYKNEHKPSTNRVQIEHRTEYKLSTNDCFSSISGIQRNLILAIYDECKKNRSTITNPVSLEYLASSVASSKNTVKVTLKRLEKKNLIIRHGYKEGRGGWTKYGLPNHIYQELLQYESIKLGTEQSTNRVQTEHKPSTEQGTQQGTSLPSSSSNINITTTTETIAQQEYPPCEIDIESLTSIGFTENHLTQLTKLGIHSDETIQDAIYAFSYDLQKKAVNPKNPLNMFMSIMKKDIYAPVSVDYENPQVKARRLYLEKRRKIEEQKSKVEEELSKEHFSIWRENLSEDDKNKLLSEDAKNSTIKSFKIAELSAYHKEHVWPDVRFSFYRERGLASF